MSAYVYLYPDLIQVKTPVTVGRLKEVLNKTRPVRPGTVAMLHEGEPHYPTVGTSNRGLVDDSYVLNDNEWIELCPPMGHKG